MKKPLKNKAFLEKGAKGALFIINIKENIKKIINIINTLQNFPFCPNNKKIIEK